MSLKLLAKQMEAKGRGGDSVLVHMTPGEVAGLQKLAESGGGSLTVNPETGLVEANFLKRMLPTLVGIGVGIGTGNPFLGAAAGAAVGGYQAKENDQDVLMGAGLGALGGYGGAGLGAGLTAAGGTAAAAGAGTAATGASTAATGAAGAGTAGTAASMTGDAAVAEAIQRQAAEQALAEQATQETIAQNAAAESQRQATRDIMTGYNPNAVTPEMSYAAQPQSMATEYGLNTGTAQTSPLTVGESFNQAGRGIGQMGTEEGRAAFGQNFGMKQAAAGAAPAMAPEKIDEEGVPVDDEMYYTEYTPGQTGERSDTSTESRQFEGRFSPMEKIKAADYMDRVRRREIYAAKGGLMALAEGGVAGNSGPTAEAMDYLMGDSGASQAGLQYLMGGAPRSAPMQARAQVQRNDFVMPTRGESVTSTLDGYREIATGPYQGLYEKTDGKLAYDPTAQKFYRSDDVFKYVPPPPAPAYDYYNDGSSGGNAAGGLLSLAKGGMKSGGFVIPADVVSMVGEGNTDAGYSRIKSMVPGATAIKGKDGGQADTVKTSIEGKQPARVAHGEMYVPPETVKRMGGAKKLYAMMDKVRAQATGSKKQIKPVSLKKALA